MTCDARIRPFPGDTEVRCAEAKGHEGGHAGELIGYAYPGSVTVIGWMEDDRRTFHGDWPGDCSEEWCCLPLGHRGRHA